jgi:calcium-translocating P-type ATPase
LFYQKEAEDVIKEFSSSKENGLAQAEIDDRVIKYGKNVIAREKKESMFLKFLASFGDIFALLLITAAFISFFLGGPTGPRDATVILGIIILNSTIGFIQEYKAAKIVEALSKILPKKAIVLRDGKSVEIFSEDVTVGDILILDEGDDIPADGRIIESSNFATNDFTLTGESVPQHKFYEIIKEKVALTDIDNMVFAGTSVATGVAKVIVVAIGGETEFGKIAVQTQSIKDDPSPLQKELERSAHTVSKITLVIGAMIFILNIALGEPFSSSLVFALSLAVAMVPEGLPTTISIALALAVKKMAKKNALVKKLSAVETLGSATVICTDKTGTVTKNEMTVKEVWTNNNNYHVKGIGYSPIGEINFEDKKINFNNFEEIEIANASVYCNNAQLVEPQGEESVWSIVGDPTEGALLTFAQKVGISKKESNIKIRKLLEIPFSSEIKRMSVAFDFKDDGIVSYTKGASGEVLKLCKSISVNGKNEPIDKYKTIIEEKVDDFAKQGLRILAFARKEYKYDKDVNKNSIEKDLIFIGLVGMIDPPKDGVAEAVRIAKGAGIKIFMITGDYGLTAATIAQRVGIVGKNYALLTGLDLLKMKDGEISRVLKTQDVIFSRTAPDQKIRIVSILQKDGEVVAVTGDGVNDAPALRKADIGVAMGICGTDVSKEASDIILLDDNFKTIVEAIKEGRVVYSNLKKFVHYIFSSNVGELFAVITGLALGLPTTIAAIQILAVDLGTDVLPSLALAADPEPDGIMKKRPRDQKERLLNKKAISGFFFIGMIMGIGAAIAFMIFIKSNGWQRGEEIELSLYLAATTVTYASLVFSQIANVLSTHTGRKSFISQLFTNKYLVWACVASIFILNLFMFAPVVKDFLEMKSPGLLGISLAFLVGVFGFIAIKIRNTFGSYIAE